MDTNSSYEAVLFLEHFALNSNLLVDKNGVRHPLYHAYNGGEHAIKNWHCDGYSPSVDGKPVFVEYHGCAWHGCSECGQPAHDDGNDEAQMKRYESEWGKIKLLKSLGTFHLERECRWLARKKKLPNCETSLPWMWQRFQTHDELLDGIDRGQLYGFARTMVESPRSLTQAPRLRGFFYPPVVAKIKLDPAQFDNDIDMEHFPQEPQLTQVYNTTEPVLLHTNVIQFLMELGCSIKIDLFVQYKGERCFKPFVDKVTKLRMDAKRQGNEPKNLTSKLIGNSAYGKTLGNTY